MRFALLSGSGAVPLGIGLVFLLQSATMVCAQSTLFAENEWTNPPGSNHTDATNPRFRFRATKSGFVDIELNYRTFYVNTKLWLLPDPNPNPVRISDNISEDNKDSRISAFEIQAGSEYTIVAGCSDKQLNPPTGRFRLEIRPTNPECGSECPEFVPAVPVAPYAPFTKQPTGLSTAPGPAVVFSVNTGLVEKLKWQKTGIDILGANAYSFNLLSASTTDNGSYTCIAYYRDLNGTLRAVPSSPANLTVSGDRQISSNTWKQDKFIIGTTVGPTVLGNPALDDVEYEKFRDAGFNMTAAVPRGLLAETNWMSFALGVSNNYRISRVAAVNAANPDKHKLQTMAFDERFSRTDIRPNAASIQAAVGVGGDYQFPASANMRDALFGYFVSDEPWHRLFDPAGGSGGLNTGEQLKKLELLAADASKPAWINLRSSWGFYSETEYIDYIRKFAFNSETKIISFDYYVLDKRAPTGYAALPIPGDGSSTYFRHHQYVAEALKEAKAPPYNKVMSFWGFGCVTEHSPAPNRLHLLPDESQLRFQAFTPLLYGAKGLIWFTYELANADGYTASPVRDASGGTPNSPRTDELLERLRKVNQELLAMGPLLMNLEWQTTIHGDDVDDVRNEVGLPTKSSTPSILSSTVHIPENFAIGILKHTIGKEHYLLILNKDITNPSTESPAYANSVSLTAATRGIPYRYNKATGVWNPIPFTREGSNVAFTVVNHLPGDLEIIRLAHQVQPWKPLLIH